MNLCLAFGFNDEEDRNEHFKIKYNITNNQDGEFRFKIEHEV